jgi:ABC-type transport system involved in cytochrome bd biosynthesis fused ATPase/permease subunit
MCLHFRSNLDPWDKHSDARLWEVLGAVKLKEHISGSQAGLLARMQVRTRGHFMRVLVVCTHAMFLPMLKS